MSKIIFGFPSDLSITQKIGEKLGLEFGQMTMRKFPDSETFLKIFSDVKDREVIVVCGLSNPDVKILPLLFFAEAAKELGAKSVGLVSPYLAYMRQDKRFSEGEGVTSKYFASLLSQYVDWLVTIDPHLHRYKSLSEIYSIPTYVLHASDLISAWIKKHIDNPVLVGPDEESEQWVSGVAQIAEAPFFVLEKHRHDNGVVEISTPPTDSYTHHTPVLVDDIISTANTMIETVRQLKNADMNPPICVGIHGIFAEHAYDHLLFTGIAKLVTCNTIEHVSNGIDVSDLIVEAIKAMK